MNVLSNKIDARNTVFVKSKTAAMPVAANLNSVRGLACLLVVALHVVGDTASTGLHLPMTSDWHYAMESIEFLRMPMFTALSGYLYAGRRVTQANLGPFWTKKLRRLAVPLVFVTSVEWYLRRHAYGDATPLWQDLVFSFGHLWYIQTLILLFLGISLCDAFIRPGTSALVLAGLTTVMIAQAGITLPTFFSLYGVSYLAPYFLFGIILREHPKWLANPRTGAISFGIVAIVLTAQQLGLFGLTTEVTLLQLPAALAGMAGVTFLLQRLPANPLLVAVGGYSYTIYLWHIMASASIREVLWRDGVTSLPVVFVVCLIGALVIPIILYHVARRLPLLSIMITGESRIPLSDRIMRKLHGRAAHAIPQ